MSDPVLPTDGLPEMIAKANRAGYPTLSLWLAALTSAPSTPLEPRSLVTRDDYHAERGVDG